MRKPCAFILIAILGACSSTLDHQSELLLHPEPVVQIPALVGAVAGGVLGFPVWGTVALFAGHTGDAAAYATHAFVYPPALALAGIPWLLAGPSWD